MSGLSARIVVFVVSFTVLVWGVAPALWGQGSVEQCSSPNLPFGGEFGTPVTVTDTLALTPSIVIAQLDVVVDITHTWVGDIELDLTSPGASTVRLHDGAGGQARDLQLTFSDSGVPHGLLPFDYGCYMQPQGPGSMADFNGGSSAGSWQLTVTDNFPAEDDGTLRSWCVRGYDAPPLPAPAGVQGLTCVAGSLPNTVQLFWNNPVSYDTIAITASGTPLATLAGSSTSFETPVTSGAPPHELSVVGIVDGAQPSCPMSCTLQTAPVAHVEACGSPGTVLVEGPHSEIITVDSSIVAQQVNVRVDLTHTWIGDLTIAVSAPSGTSLTLHANAGGDANDIRLTFSDDGVSNGSSPYDFGCFMRPPAAPMADLAGPAQGDWTLTLTDTYPASDFGVLEQWCVRVFDTPPSTPPAAVEQLSCSPGSLPGVAELSWTNPVPYDSLLIRINGEQVAQLPAGTESYTTPSFADGTLLDVEVSGVFTTSAPSCPTGCVVQIELQYNAFMRGDVNVDGVLALPDALFLLNHLFIANSSPPPCLDAADINDDEALGIPDVISLLNYLFLAGSPPIAPGLACGPDPTNDLVLTCQSYPLCLGVTDLTLAGHVLRRVAFGPSPSSLDRVLDIGVLPYLEEQVLGDPVNDVGNIELQSRLSGLNPATDLNHLYRWQLLRALYGNNQLREQLTSFWEAHFNTYIWTTSNYFVRLPIYNSSQALEQAVLGEYLENEALRSGSLGNFQTLLETSATSVTMLIYLDNISNVAGNPNENYARELLELHSMGVDNGYTQSDIEEIARCFTGWTICQKNPADVGDGLAPCVSLGSGQWSFHFDPGLHDYNAKIIFPGTPYALTIPARPLGSPQGLDDGFEVIAHLVGLPQTAEYISTKLIQKFVSDTPPPNLVATCIGAWLTSGGDIAEVMTTITESTAFLGTSNRWNKVETPFENLVSAVRAFQGSTNAQPMLNSLGEQAQVPFNFFTPDGYPESGGDQLGTALILERIRYARRFNIAGDPQFDFGALLLDRGVPLTDAEGIVDEFLRLLYQGQHTPVDRQLALEFLETNDNGVPAPLNPAAGDYESRLAKLAAFMASWPQGMKQ